MAYMACLSSVLWLGGPGFKESSSVTSSSNTFNLTRQSRATVKHDQRRFGIRELESCNGRQIVGSLGFSCTQMFGRFGRAKLRPFSRRQHEHRQFWLNHQLTSALKWWLQILSCSPPRLVPTDLSARRRIFSYSVGEGSEAGIGVALWEKRNSSGTCRCPSSSGRSSDIVGPSETLGPF